jgi:hypothetical protein
VSEQVHFYPWLRQGWAGSPLPVDPGIGDLEAQVALTIDLRVNAETVRATAMLLGPGDVIGINRREVIRTDPAPYGRAFEPNCMACIEFDQPGFPWLFTPASPDDRQRLRPWLCLVVVQKQQGVSLTVDAAKPLPVLSIGEPADMTKELPDLSDSWGWAHAQVTAFDSTLAEALTAHPERSLSRLLCPRMLAPEASYYACLVPAFEAGRLAGLGLPPTEQDLTTLGPAWRLDDPPQSLLLPVYHHWEFATGAGGDFASLARQLHPQRLGSEIGIAPLDVGEAGAGLPAIIETSPDRTLGLEGALTSSIAERRGFTGQDGLAFQAAMSRLLAPQTSGEEEPSVGPPVYGDRHAGISSLPSAGTPPHWLRELNLDPRYRVVAALGTKAVQEHQEPILSSIWRQSGEIARANSILRNAQFARTVGSAVLRRRIKSLSADALLQITRDIQGRLPGETGTLRQSVDSHVLSSSFAVPQFRRIARPRGPRLRPLLPAASRTVLSIFKKVATNLLDPVLLRPEGGIVTVERVEHRFRELGGTRPPGELVSYQTWAATDAAALPGRPAFEVRTPEPLRPPGTPPVPIAPPGPTDSFSAGRLRAAMIAHQPGLFVPPTVQKALMIPLELQELSDRVIAQLDPALKLSARLHRVITPPEGAAQSDPFDPVLATPELERPMYEALRDLFPSLMLPGLSEIEDNTVGLLVTNPRFVEAFLIGVNHELGRELLWRGFPARSRTTYFRHFWDRRGQPGQDALPADIPPIADWDPASRPGEIAEGSEGQVVILVRGELTRRYPNAIYYMVEAARDPVSTKLTLGTRELYPQFRGSLGQDMSFFGFALAEDVARGDASQPGWYFVIQQAPGEPRFGVPAEAAVEATFLTPEADSAATARRFLLKPVRVALHASSLLP